jgi:hypothetical protein
MRPHRSVSGRRRQAKSCTEINGGVSSSSVHKTMLFRKEENKKKEMKES